MWLRYTGESRVQFEQAGGPVLQLFPGYEVESNGLRSDVLEALLAMECIEQLDAPAEPVDDDEEEDN